MLSIDSLIRDRIHEMNYLETAFLTRLSMM